MVSERMFLLSATCYLLVSFTSSKAIEMRSEDDINSEEEKELIEALQEVLVKLRSKQMPSTEKKFGWVPACDAGEQCAIRKGARFGRLCSCAGGRSCDFSILKCL